MSTGTKTRPTKRQRFIAALPVGLALTLIGAVWAAGAVWSFEEQTAFANAAGFHIPQLLPLVLDGMAVAMAAVAYAASLDARPAVLARLGTALAVACSAASNVAWAWERSGGDPQTIALAGGVPIVANLAFEVLLGEVRRQVLRRRGQPGPVAITYPRLVRLALAPWPTFVAWRRLVLAATDPAKAFTGEGNHQPIRAELVDESDPDIQACRQLQRETATAMQSLAPRVARIGLADAMTHWSAATDRPHSAGITRPAVATAPRPELPAVASPPPATQPTTVATSRPTTKRPTVVAKTSRRVTTKSTRKPATEADRTAAAFAALVAELGRPPTGSELATKAGVSRSYANGWKRDNAPPSR
ncbi:DUF2637 domain-containing protein [Micromonospora zingiberis]|uniref:DUF2637 domain-containing protein n=1 Tax=Micromonospora zingiberis TaxID=2053011 RepID=A0A4R0GL63_9ACTN|nr:DUF2637 domain-containing protein [Micromonospora zingiberis]TCB97597.1 DUF2637 domain-containing protein [Micromonospora zingiberis]